MFSNGVRLPRDVAIGDGSWQTRGMKTRIVCLPIGRVGEGMTLAANLVGRDRKILLAADTVLDADMVDRLSRRGVETVAVHQPDPRDARTIALDVQEAEARVAHIFRGPGGPARAALQAAILRYRQDSSQ